MVDRPQLRRLRTKTPEGPTLAIMGDNARRTADTFTMREWAGRLAARAGPRDYVGQLRELYRGIVDRWRYVQETGEWVHGSPRALLGYTLGLNYNRGPDCPHPERCDVEATPTTPTTRGWGDCDDVSMVAAAGAIALGMRPLWRVVRWPGGAHVSTVVQTPRGEWVSVDPVGHPDHGFGWALDPPGGSARYFGLDGRPTHGPTNGGAGSMATTLLSGPHGHTMALRAARPHVVLTRPGDRRGSRTLAMPLWNYRLLKRGVPVDGTPAVDQFGEQYTYLAGADVWAPLGNRRARRRARRKKRRARRRRIVRRVVKAVRRVTKPITRVIRKGYQRLMKSKVAQAAASKALQAFGVPPQATKAIMQREAEIAKRGGRARMLELISQGKMKEAAGIALKATGAGVAHGIRAGIPALGRLDYATAYDTWRAGPRGFGDVPEDADDLEAEGREWVMVQDGATYTVAPVSGFAGLAGVVDMGQIEAQTTVHPGTFYKIQRGDTLLSIGQRLNDGRSSGGPFGSRLAASKVINQARFNRRFWRDSEPGFERNNYGPNIISLNPRFSSDVALGPGQSRAPSGNTFATIWIPATNDGSDDPPELCPPGSEFDDGVNQCVPLPEPEPPEPEPEEPIDEPPEPELPDEPEPPPPPEPEPEEPEPPIEPAPPELPDIEPDEPEPPPVLPPPPPVQPPPVQPAPAEPIPPPEEPLPPVQPPPPPVQPPVQPRPFQPPPPAIPDPEPIPPPDHPAPARPAAPGPGGLAWLAILAALGS